MPKQTYMNQFSYIKHFEGMTREQVIAELGQPLKSRHDGPAKVMKYESMTLTLQDGRVAGVEVEMVHK